MKGNIEKGIWKQWQVPVDEKAKDDVEEHEQSGFIEWHQVEVFPNKKHFHDVIDEC